jgi:hypothetical protein
MAVRRIASSVSTAEVLDRVLDKGIVVEAEIRIAVAGIELVTVSALVRIASFATWARYVGAGEHRAPRPGSAARADEAGVHRVRLRCEQGCTLERRASTLVVSGGVFAPQRCVLKPRRACPVTVL